MPDVERIVLDASAVVDLLIRSTFAHALEWRLARTESHAPAHLDAEVISALGRLERAGTLTGSAAGAAVRVLADLPIHRHQLGPLLMGAWQKRGSLRLVDALYVELADQLDVPIVTTDRRLAQATSRAESIAPN